MGAAQSTIFWMFVEGSRMQNFSSEIAYCFSGENYFTCGSVAC